MVSALQLRGLSADFVRGALLTAGALAIARPIVPAAAERIAGSNWLLVFLLAGLGVSVAASALWRLAPAVARVRWYAAIACAAAIAVAVTR